MRGANRSRRRRAPLRLSCTVSAVVLLVAIPLGLWGSGSSPSHPVRGESDSLSTALAGTSFDWPELHRTPQLTGYTANTTLSASNASNLGVKWDADLYGAALDSPVTAFDPALGETLAYIGTERGDVLAINVATGRSVWGQWLGSQIRGTPIVSNGSVFVTTDSTPAVYKLNATTGAIGCHLVAPMPIESSPIVVTPTGGVATLYVGSLDSSTVSGPLLAMNAGNCSLEWQFTGFNRTAGSWVAISYAVDAHGEPLIVFGTSDPDSSVYALDAKTGAEVWRYQTYNPGTFDIGAGSAISPPGANGFPDGMVYAPSKYGRMYALDLTTGILVWYTQFDHITAATEDGRSTPALDGTNLVFGNYEGMFDLNATNGAVIWQYVDSTHTEIIASPALAGPLGAEVVAAADVSGHVDVVSLAAGALLYQYKTGGYIAASPAVSNGNILVASADGFLYDFDVGGGNDPSLPTVGITSPVGGAPLTNPMGELVVAGNATDVVGVASVQVAIQSSGPSGPWWDSTSGSWVAGPVADLAMVNAPGSTSTTWTFGYPVPTAGGVYQVTAYAVSASGQSSITSAVIDYTVLSTTKGPHIKVGSAFIAPGASTSVTGGGFAKSETVELVLNGAVVASATTSPTGSLPSTKLKVPASTPFGLYSILATGLTSGRSASATVTVANSWEQSGFQAGQTNYAPNDPVLDHHVNLGDNTWLRLAWHFDAEVPVNASPAVVDGVAYVGDTLGQLFALDVQNGGLLWTWTVPSHGAIRGSPAVDPAHKLVIVSASDGTLNAVTASTGSLVWSKMVGGQLTAPVFGNGFVYVASSTGQLLSFVEASGALSWSASLASSVAAAPSLDTTHGMVIVGEANGELVALSSGTGAPAWTFPTGGAVEAAATISGNVVYVGSGDGSVYALGEATGAKLWSFATGSPIRATGAFLTQGTVLGKPEYAVGSSGGDLYVLQAATGTLNFVANGSASVVGVGAVNGIIVLETSAGTVSATRGYVHLLLWTYHTLGTLATSPVIVDGTIYVGAADGNLYAFTTYGQPPD
jgi:outer membrane protein assembly factor BamB